MQRIPLAIRATLGAGALALGLHVSAASASDLELTVGVLNDQSGPYADATGRGSVVAAEIAIEEVGGSVLGKKIKLVTADHQNKVDIASGIATKWIDVDGVDVILDVPNSGVLLALQEIVRNKGGVLIASGGGASTFTGPACSPYGFQWTYDTYSTATAIGSAIVREGGKSWFFLQVDYAFGTAMAADLKAAVTAAGGTVVGSVKHPINTADFSSFLLQAQASGADVIALMNAGGDTVNAIKQASEFGITSGKQRIAAMLLHTTDVQALGFKASQGILAVHGFDANQNAETKAWAERFAARHGRYPTAIQIGVYSGLRHYLKAVEAAGTDERDAVVAKMRELPVSDPFVQNGKVRADGLMVHEMHLLDVKSPEESKAPGDVFKIVRSLPGDEVFRPLEKGGCPLVKN